MRHTRRVSLSSRRLLPAKRSVAVALGVATALLLTVIGGFACGASIASPSHAADDKRCRPPVKAAKWRHRLHGGRVASKLGSPRHVVADVLAGAEQEISIAGKFAYGDLSKDVEDETVELWQQLEPCRWRPLGRLVTDDDGRARFTVPATTFSGPGPHRVRVYLLGDRSYAEGKVWIVAPGTPVVLFDIDGTLTKDDGELFEELLGSKAEMHDGADAVARRWADLGYLPIYITGRPYPLRASTFAWLGAHRFPLGPVFTVDSLLDFLPSEGHVGEFKLGALRQLLKTGIRFHRAYGNASTDICAYARAGISPDRTFIVGGPRPGCDPFAAPHPLPSYVDHLPKIGDDQRLP